MHVLNIFACQVAHLMRAVQRGVSWRRDHHLDPAGGGAALLAAAPRGLRAAGAEISHQKLYDGNCLIM